MMNKKKYISPEITKKQVKVNQFFNSRFFDSFDMLLTPNAVFATSHGGSGGCSSASSGCNACLLPGSKVLMYGGEEKNIEEVLVGDTVLSFDSVRGKMREAYILSIEVKKREGGYFILNDTLRITDDHPVFVSGKGFMKVCDLCTGDRLIDFEGKEMMLKSIDMRPGVHRVYNPHLSIECGAYFVEGVLVQDYWGSTVYTHHFPQQFL